LGWGRLVSEATYPAITLDLGPQTGWCIDTGLQVIWGTKRLKGDLGQRVAELQDWLSDVLMGMQLVVYEAPFIGYATAARTGHAYESALLAEVHRQKILTMSVPPKSLKKFATNNGNANKDRMLEALEREWVWLSRGAEFDEQINDHEVDAIWLMHFAKRTGWLNDRGTPQGGGNGIPKGFVA
jgi:Holliday junction resolvasome RuvABC endonuclease subunit